MNNTTNISSDQIEGTKEKFPIKYFQNPANYKIDNIKELYENVVTFIGKGENVIINYLDIKEEINKNKNKFIKEMKEFSNLYIETAINNLIKKLKKSNEFFFKDEYKSPQDVADKIEKLLYLRRTSDFYKKEEKITDINRILSNPFQKNFGTNPFVNEINTKRRKETLLVSKVTRAIIQNKKRINEKIINDFVDSITEKEMSFPNVYSTDLVNLEKEELIKSGITPLDLLKPNNLYPFNGKNFTYIKNQKKRDKIINEIPYFIKMENIFLIMLDYNISEMQTNLSIKKFNFSFASYYTSFIGIEWHSLWGAYEKLIFTEEKAYEKFPTPYLVKEMNAWEISHKIFRDAYAPEFEENFIKTTLLHNTLSYNEEFKKMVLGGILKSDQQKFNFSPSVGVKILIALDSFGKAINGMSVSVIETVKERMISENVRADIMTFIYKEISSGNEKLDISLRIEEEVEKFYSLNNMKLHHTGVSKEGEEIMQLIKKHIYTIPSKLQDSIRESYENRTIEIKNITVDLSTKLVKQYETFLSTSDTTLELFDILNKREVEYQTALTNIYEKGITQKKMIDVMQIFLRDTNIDINSEEYKYVKKIISYAHKENAPEKIHAVMTERFLVLLGIERNKKIDLKQGLMAMGVIDGFGSNFSGTERTRILTFAEKMNLRTKESIERIADDKSATGHKISQELNNAFIRHIEREEFTEELNTFRVEMQGLLEDVERFALSAQRTEINTFNGAHKSLLSAQDAIASNYSESTLAAASSISKASSATVSAISSVSKSH